MDFTFLDNNNHAELSSALAIKGQDVQYDWISQFPELDFGNKLLSILLLSDTCQV